MQTVLWTTEGVCRVAVEQYVAALGEAGIPVSLSEAGEDGAVCEWGLAEPEFEEDDAWDEFGDGEDQKGATDESVGRMAEHYGKTLELLAADPELAREWLEKPK